MMMKHPIHTLNVGGRLISLASPMVMGIINLTPDSFYAPSRKQEEAAILGRARQIMEEGGSIIDIGAYSSRPGAEDISTEEEMTRLRHGIPLIRQAAPQAILSVDTFRADIARMCVEELGVDIINDISGGELDGRMFDTISQLHVPYILMHMKGNPRTMQQQPEYEDIMAEMMLYFSKKINQLHELGVSDIIIDPGFGFAKTLEHNYHIMGRLEDFHELEQPLLVGISRKSMIFRLLGNTPQDALNGTTVLNTIALCKGASILRVHDVREATEAAKIYQTMQNETQAHD